MLSKLEKLTPQPSLTFELPFPPSANQMYRSVGRGVKLSEKGRAYYAKVRALFTAHGVTEPLDNPMSIHFKVIPPDNRRRDLDNLGKALCDSLTKSLVIQDDSLIDQLIFTRYDKDKDNPRVIAVITEYL